MREMRWMVLILMGAYLVAWSMGLMAWYWVEALLVPVTAAIAETEDGWNYNPK